MQCDKFYFNRTIAEVTYMANKLKENFYRLPGQDDEDKDGEYEIPKKQKTRGGKIKSSLATNDAVNATESSNVSAWSQLQQKALEAALTKFSKGPADRWEKIAKCVPDKTKVRVYFFFFIMFLYNLFILGRMYITLQIFS